MRDEVEVMARGEEKIIKLDERGREREREAEEDTNEKEGGDK